MKPTASGPRQPSASSPHWLPAVAAPPATSGTRSRSSPTTRSRPRARRSTTPIDVVVGRDRHRRRDRGRRATPARWCRRPSLTAGNPEGDVMWGVDNTYLSRVVERRGVRAVRRRPVSTPSTRPMRRPGAERRGDAGRLRRRLRQLRHRVVRRARASSRRPTSTSLADPAYRDLLVVENPASSSPGLAFLHGAVAEFGERRGAGWVGLLVTARRQRRRGRRRLDRGLLRAVQRHRRRAAAARRELRDQPAGRGALRRSAVDEPPTGVLADTCFRQVEFAGVLRGTDSPDEARAFVDFLIAEDFQSRGGAEPVRVPGQRRRRARPGVHRLRRRPRRPAHARPRRDRRQPQPWIETGPTTSSVTRRPVHVRPSNCGAQPAAALVRRRRSPRCRSCVLAVFYALAVRHAAGRGRSSPSTAGDTLGDPTTWRVVWFTLWQAVRRRR